MAAVKFNTRHIQVFTVFCQNIDPNGAPAVGLTPLVEVVKDRVPAQNLIGKELFGGQFTPLTSDRRTGLFSAGEKCIRQFR